MRVIDIATTANTNLRRSKLRTFLTLLAIGIGTLTLSLSLGLGEGVKTYISSQLGSFSEINLYQVTKANSGPFSGGGFGGGEPVEYTGQSASINDFSQLFLSEQDIKNIESINGVSELSKPWSPTFDYVVGANYTKYTAPAELFIAKAPPSIIAGELIDKNEPGNILMSRKFIGVVGVTSSQEAVGKTVKLTYTDNTGSQKTENFTIKGVYEPTLIDQAMKISVNDAERIATVQAPMGTPQFIAVFVSRDQSISDEAFKQAFKDNEFEAQSLADINNTLNNIVFGVQVALGAFSAIAILASIVGVINTLFMAVLERTREIGLFRAMGAKRKTIFSLFAVEAMLLGFWGSVFGLIFAYISQKIINNIASNTFLKGIEGFQLVAITPQLAITIVIII
nr:FtsX-like permease family protein [Patescibacteria group bacterium]